MPVTPEPAMEVLVAAVVRVGTTSGRDGIVRDLAALLARARNQNPAVADRVMSATRTALASNQAALDLLSEVDRRSQAGGELPFGPVRNDDPAAVDRLALLTQISGLAIDILFPFFSKAVQEFVLASVAPIPLVAATAAAVQERLGRTTLDALHWRDAALPPILGASFDLVGPVVVGTGGAVPSEWTATANWIQPWVDSRPTLDPDSPLVLDDGFLTGDRPLALHPLVLHILRPRVADKLHFDEPKKAEHDALAFCRFLHDRGAASDADVARTPTLFAPAGSPGGLLSAGAALISFAQGYGVRLNADGSTSGEFGPWAGYVERVLRTLIFGCESGLQVLPPSWQDKNLLHDLLQQAPDWAQSRFGGPLRARAKALAVPEAANLNQAFSQSMPLIPAAIVRSNIDNLAVLPARPKTTRRATTDGVKALVDLRPVVERISSDAAARRKVFAGRFSGPIGEPLLLGLLPTGATADGMQSGPYGTLLAGQVASMSATSLRDEFLEGQLWASIVNASGDPQRRWAALECWDGLRGRLVEPVRSGDNRLAVDLSKALPDWLGGHAAPPASIDLTRLRPLLAAVTLLGLPAISTPDLAQATKLADLRARLHALLDPAVQLGADTRALIAAAQIELTISSIAASPRDLQLGQIFDSVAGFAEFARLAEMALLRPVAWEARAGLNGFILLSRMAELTSDPLIGAVVDQSLPAAVSELVAASAVRLLNPSPASLAMSGLPLAFAASSLTRFVRERSRALAFASPIPSWLGAGSLTTSLRNNPDAMIAALTAAFQNPQAAPLSGFAWQGGRAGRTLLLALYQIGLQTFGMRRRLTIDPLRPSDPGLQSVQQLEAALRQTICIERLLLTGLPQDATGSKLVPWWSIRYWSNLVSGPTRPTAAGEDDNRTIWMINWASVASVDVSANQLALAAGLAGDTPLVREGEPVDVDRRSEFALPNLSFKKATDNLNDAIAGLTTAEQDFTDAILKQAQLADQAEIIALLKKPLLLATADANEQVEAADAEIRRAQADLDAAEHELTASQFEDASAALIYQASLLEIKMQDIRQIVSGLQSQMADLDAKAAAIDVNVAGVGETIAQKMVSKAKLLQQAAQARLDQATNSRSFVKQKIDLLTLILKTPVDPGVPGAPPKVPGLISRMAWRISTSLTTKLDADLAEARAALESAEAEEERRRAIEREASFIKGILALAGAVVGFVVGGPGGAALGGAIAGMAGDLVGGIIEKRPIEEIVVGLAGDAFTASKAAGVNLDGVLAEVGTVGGGDADQIFGSLDSTLKPVLANLPNVLNGALLRDSFKDLTFVNVPSGELIDDVLNQVQSSVGSPGGDLAAAFGDAGVGDLIVFDDAETFLSAVSDHMANTLGKSPDALVAEMRRLAGMDAGAPIREISRRLSTLVATRVGMASSGYRQHTLSAWIEKQQSRHKQWNDVATAGTLLIGRLFPDPAARSEVLANVRLTLMSPRTFQAEIQTLMAPWQQELDRRIADVQAAGDAAVASMGQPSNPVGAAQARVNYITASRDKFFAVPGGLFDFLKGNAPQRLELIQKLEDELQQDQTAQGELRIDGLVLQGAEQDVGIAQAALTQAGLNRDHAQTMLEKYQVAVEVASWQNKLNEIAGQQAATMSEAQQTAEQSAAEKVNACEARVAAARANLEARRAYAAAARKRAAEASRIRDALSQPPLRLHADQILDGTMALAGSRHMTALDRGLKAAREILRLLRLIPKRGGLSSLPMPAFGGPVPFRWSDFLKAQVHVFEETLQQSGPVGNQTSPLNLGREQIDALLSTGGLKLFFRPALTNVIAGDRIQHSIEDTDARNGRIVAVLVSGTTQDGTEIFDDIYRPSAQYRGDHWITKSDVRFIDVQNLSPSRVDVKPPAMDPVAFILQSSALHDVQGDQNFRNVPGTPISGTTVLRLRAVPLNPPAIRELQVIVLFNTVVPN